MEESKSVYLAPNSLIICVDTYDKKVWSGRLFSHFSREPKTFTDSHQLLFRMEAFYDWYGFPQPSMKSRSFKQSGEQMAVWQGKQKEESIVLTDDEMMDNRGDKATFVVHIQYRQNATWQGTVVWAEQQKSCNFRSALELLKLIDSALDKES